MKLFAFFFILITTSYTNAGKLILGAAEWCPYTCSSLKNGGIVHEYIETIAKNNNIEIEIKFLPWNRAVQMAQTGGIDGLLTGVKEEAPKLVFTTTPTMQYRSCAFSTSKQRKISANQIESKRIAYISSYSYGEPFDSILKKETISKIEIKGKDPLLRLKRLVDSKRADIFIEDEKVAKFYLGKGISPLFCGVSTPFFLGVNGQKSIGLKFLNILNKEIKKTEKLLKKIILNTIKVEIAKKERLQKSQAKN